MTLFDRRTLMAAYRHSAAGGQSLYICRVQPKNREIAWLLDDNIERLMAKSRQLGARTVVVNRAHLPGQYVILSGVALARAWDECQPELFPS